MSTCSNGNGRDVTPLCAKCSALCCRQLAMPLDVPESANDFDNIRWYLMHENVHVFVEDGEWYIAFATRCKHLQDDNRCGVYETRPRICRTYKTDGCEWHGGEYDYDHLFTSAEQLRVHAEEVLGRPLPKRERVKKPAVVPLFKTKAQARPTRIALPLA